MVEQGFGPQDFTQLCSILWPIYEKYTVKKLQVVKLIAVVGLFLSVVEPCVGIDELHSVENTLEHLATVAFQDKCLYYERR